MAANGEFLTEGQVRGYFFPGHGKPCLVRNSPGFGGRRCASPSRSTAQEDGLPDSTARGSTAPRGPGPAAPCRSQTCVRPRRRALPALWPPRRAPRPGLLGPPWQTRRDGACGTFLGAPPSTADPRQEMPGPPNLPFCGRTRPRARLTQMPCLIRAAGEIGTPWGS